MCGMRLCHREPSSGLVAAAGMRSFVDALLSIGAYPEESETQRARRRIILATIWVASLLVVVPILIEFVSGFFWAALSDTGVLVVTAVTLMGLHLRPRQFAFDHQPAAWHGVRRGVDQDRFVRRPPPGPMGR